MRRFLVSCVALSLISLSTARGVELTGSEKEVKVINEEDFNLLETEINNLQKKFQANQSKADVFRRQSEDFKSRNRVRARMLMQKASYHEKVMDSAESQIKQLKKRIEETEEAG
jgi:ribosomal protein S15P/S13E